MKIHYKCIDKRLETHVKTKIKNLLPRTKVLGNHKIQLLIRVPLLNTLKHIHVAPFLWKVTKCARHRHSMQG